MSLPIRRTTTEGTDRPTVTKTDDAGSGVTYVGSALTGSATSAAAWRIQKITVSSGDATVEWADGNDSYDNIWDNRAALSYS